LEQTIKFCTAPDGVRIAYATAGKGPPIVKVGNWLTHLEFDWKSPVWRHVLEGLAEHRQLIRYDVRGTGLSDRDVRDISFEHFVTDLGAVVDTLGLERFPLFGISQGGAVGIAYAIRNPQRVSHLILLGCFARGAAHRPTQGPGLVATRRAIIRQGWGSDDPSYRELFSAQFLPDGTPEQLQWFGELERVSATAEVAEKIAVANASADVRALLPQVKIPTLILHSRGDRRVPLDIGHELAANIGGSRFVTLESNNHLILAHEPATEVFFNEVAGFLGDKKPTSWKRRARATGTKIQTITRELEASPIYKVVGILAAVTSLVSFIVWLLA
jgi:pimeloyl-ACP methyl ester carboxylesterase